MFVESTDGYYVLDVEARERSSSAAPSGRRGLDLDLHGDIAFVQTLSESDDERVDLLFDYWDKGEPTVELRQWATGWPHVARGMITVAESLWVLSSDRSPVAQLTPIGGTFGFAVHARNCPPELRVPDSPVEEHYLVCWPADQQ